MSKLHPLFDSILRPVSGRDKALGPDYVTDNLGRLCHAPQPFDEFDDDLMHDLVGNKRLAKPVQTLLVTLWQMEQLGTTFGTEPEKALEMVKKELIELREACKEEYEENL